MNMGSRAIAFAIALSAFSCNAPQSAPPTANAGTEEAVERTPPPEPACAPLALEIDGEESVVPHGLAVGSNGGLTVHLFSSDAITCEDVLRGGWASPPGLTWTMASWTAERGRVSVGNRSAPASIQALDSPAEVGGRVALCVTEPVSFPRGIGRAPAMVSGRFEGVYCGERD